VSLTSSGAASDQTGGQHLAVQPVHSRGGHLIAVGGVASAKASLAKASNISDAASLHFATSVVSVPCQVVLGDDRARQQLAAGSPWRAGCKTANALARTQLTEFPSLCSLQSRSLPPMHTRIPTPLAREKVGSSVRVHLRTNNGPTLRGGGTPEKL
jgi:hypothetical protein